MLWMRHLSHGGILFSISISFVFVLFLFFFLILDIGSTMLPGYLGPDNHLPIRREQTPTVLYLVVVIIVDHHMGTLEGSRSIGCEIEVFELRADRFGGYCGVGLGDVSAGGLDRDLTIS